MDCLIVRRGGNGDNQDGAQGSMLELSGTIVPVITGELIAVEEEETT